MATAETDTVQQRHVFNDAPVTFVDIALCKQLTYVGIFVQYMKLNDHTSVKFVTRPSVKKAIYESIKNQFISRKGVQDTSAKRRGTKVRDTQSSPHSDSMTNFQNDRTSIKLVNAFRVIHVQYNICSRERKEFRAADIHELEIGSN